jgi:hypothetical protein
MKAVLLSIALPYAATLLCVILVSVLLNILLLTVILQRDIQVIVILQSSVVLSAILCHSAHCHFAKSLYNQLHSTMSFC